MLYVLLIKTCLNQEQHFFYLPLSTLCQFMKLYKEKGHDDIIYSIQESSTVLSISTLPTKLSKCHTSVGLVSLFKEFCHINQ